MWTEAVSQGWSSDFAKPVRECFDCLYENALILQVRTDPDSTKHITDRTVPHGWKRGMSVLADVQEVFACAGHAVVEKHEQEHEPASAEPVIEKREQEHELAVAEPPHKKQRTRVARHHIQWFLSLANRLHVHGWKKKDVFMNCQRWCPEIFGNVHADTVYRWKLDGPGGCRGRPKKITGAVAEKLTVLTHDMLRQGSCVSLDIMRTLFQDLCKKEGLEVRLSREWVRAFLVSIDLSFKAAAQRSGPKVWTLPDKVVLTKRFIMKIAFLLDTWGLDWTRTYNFDETCLSLSPTGSHGWWWKGKNEKPEFQRPSKQAVTVTLVTSPVRAQVAAQCIFHGTTERVVPDLATDVWMTCSHNHWASTETLRQLFSKMEGMVNEHTPGQDFAVLMDMAPIHVSAETKQMLQEEFAHIRVIMIPPHTTSFLQPCDVGLMRPFKSTIRRTACKNYARAIYNNTDDIGIVQPTAVPDLRANLVRLIETGVHALERDRRFEFAWNHLRSYDELWGPLLDEARQLHAAGQLFEEVREEQEEEVPETVAMLAEPEEQDMDDHESNASSDVAQDHMTDPEVEWLEPPVEAPVETPAQRMSHFLALRLVWGSPSARDLRQAAACSQE